jgi:hypothetical protein
MIEMPYFKKLQPEKVIIPLHLWHRGQVNED